VVGQDTFARAKDLYVLASYDEALLVLNRIHKSASPPESSEIAGYQVFCLLALGRTEDAQQAIAALVRADPLYRPSEATASPRTRATFDEVRRGLLPAIVTETYDAAKAAYDRKEHTAALKGFERVLALLDDPGMAGVQNMADLRRLAGGFRDLSESATAAATPPVAAPPVTASAPDLPAPTSVPAPREAMVYSADDAGVVAPVRLSKTMPPWLPRNSIEKRRIFSGVLEVLVDEKGDVLSAQLGRSIHPEYDAGLLDMARTWKFRPGTKDGVPVRYRMAIAIRLGPESSP
jgi:TonB family protein